MVTKIDEFFKGWLVGNFEPALVKTTDIEVGLKSYISGDNEPLHVHKLTTEWTCVIRGIVEMNDVIYSTGDIIEILPGIATKFRCIDDATTLVIKTPSITTDKYLL